MKKMFRNLDYALGVFNPLCKNFKLGVGCKNSCLQEGYKCCYTCEKNDVCPCEVFVTREKSS